MSDPNLLVGTETHDDAGVYRLTDDLAIVQTIDFFPPVVNDPFVYGQIAAANALSDVYAMGGTPKTALNLVGFPDDKEPLDWLGEIIRGGAERCQAAGAVVVGGHTVRDAEIKFGMAVTGFVHPQKIWTNAAAKPGDKLVLTKPLGTGFITTAAKANDCPEETFRGSLTRELALELGLAPGTDFDVAPEARARYEYTAWSDTATCLTEYEVELYEVKVCSPAALARLAADPRNRWLTEEEIERRRCHDGQPIRVTLWHVLDSLRDNPLAEPRQARTGERALSR